MPFTISHVVAILPLTSPRLSRWFVPSALVIGTMVADVPLFAPYLGSYAWSHDLLIGPITYDLVAGMIVFALWTYVLRRPLTDLASTALRGRLTPERPVHGGAWFAAGLSLVVGACTHIVWDSFTHANRWGTTTFPALNTMFGPLPVFKYLQYGCGILGLVVLVWWLARWWRRTTPRTVPPRRCPASFRRFALVVVPVVVAAVGVVSAVMAWAPGRAIWGPVLLTAGRSAWVAASLLVLGTCLAWWLGTTRRRPGWEGASVPATGEAR